NILKGTNANKNIVIPYNQNGSLLLIQKEVLLNELFPFLDLKSLLRVRTLSRELFDLVNLYLEKEVNAKKIGVIALSKDSKFYAVGKGVAHKVRSDSIWNAIFNDGLQDVEPTLANIIDSFIAGATLFKSKETAKEKINSQTFFGKNQALYIKPYLAEVTIKKDATLAKLDRDGLRYNTEKMSIQHINESCIEYIEDNGNSVMSKANTLGK
ncbi:lpg0796 family Dot/Icm T4SS effector, partial [Legionella pneumophila]